MLTFVLMNFIAVYCAYLLAQFRARPCSFSEFCIKIFIFYFSQIILTELILGIFGQLYLHKLFFLNLAMLAIVYILTKKRGCRYSYDVMNEAYAFFSSNKVALFLFSIIFVFGLVKTGINLANPPFGWDSLNYHFTFPVEWLKHANLNNPITISDDPSPTYYPINGNLFYLWLIFPFRSVFFADLGQIPFFVVAFFATYAIARRIKLSRDFAFYASALFLLVPNFFKQLSYAYVDVMVAAFFLTSVFYLYKMTESFNYENAIFFAASLGLLLGTKTIGLAYSILLIIPFLLLWLRNIKKSLKFIVVFLIVFILGGFSYVRNFLETGNPLYPFDLVISGKIIFKGVMDKVTYSAHFKAEDYNIAKLLFHEGLGPQTLVFLLPGIFIAPVTLFLRRKKVSNVFLLYLAMLPILIYCVWRYAIPLANSRYLYAFLSLGIILGFYSFISFKIPVKVINIVVVLSAIASCFELAKRSELVSSVIITVLFFIFLLLISKPGRKKLDGIKNPLVLVFVGLILLLSLASLESYYKRNEFPRYKKMLKYSHFWPNAVDAWIWLNDNTKGDNIAYIGRPVPFPLYGSGFKNNVYYVSVNAIEPAALHKFTNSHYSWGYDFESLHKNLEANGNYRFGADYTLWRGNLIKRKIGYLFVYSLHQIKGFEFPIEDKWASENKGDFLPVFTNKEVHIYKIIE